MTLNRWPLTLLAGRRDRGTRSPACGCGAAKPVTGAIRRWLPHVMTAVVAALAAYAWFVRQPGGELAVHDAWSLRQFSWYVHPAAIAAALAGLAILAPRAFWRDPAFFTVACGSAIFVFHRIRIVPEHFWATRRYVADHPAGRPLRHRDDAAAAAGWRAGPARGRRGPGVTR